MSVEAVSWALYEAPMLLTKAGKPDTTARFVLLVFAEHADKEGRNSFPGPVRVAFASGFDARTVERAVRRLEGGKLLERDGFTALGAVRWRVNLDLQRPLSDWEAAEAAAAAAREAGTARVQAHRARRGAGESVTHSESVTRGQAVTDAECVTDPETDPCVTHFASVRNALKVRYVTHSTPGEPPFEPPRTTGGMRPPPDPLRTDSPRAARRTDQATAPDRSQTNTTQLDPESPVPPRARANRAGETTWRQQRAATAHLDPGKRQEVREELEAQRRRAAFRVVDPRADESGAAS